MKIREMTKEERPREKMLRYGRQTLTNSELLALIIKSGTKKHSALDIADNIIHKNENGIRMLAEYSLEELADFEGIGTAKACVIQAAVELGVRMASSKQVVKGHIGSADDVAELFTEKLRYLEKEIFRALLLDAKGNIISEEIISIGDLTSSPVHPRETYKAAVKRSAAAVIFVHNHPSGDASPSEDDLIITKRLKEAGEILGITVLDHVIIGDGCFISLKAMGII